MEFPVVVDVFISARFGPGHPHEGHARELHRTLNRRGIIKAVIVDAQPGDDFGDMTVYCLDKMEVMVVMACEGYGEKTGNGYCSHEELKYAREKKIPILVVRMCVKWPPTPKPSKHDPHGLGASLNKFVFSQGLCTLRWHDREWNVDECAKEIEEAFINQRDASSSQAIQVPTNNVLPTTLETEYKSSCALGKLNDNQIDVCIISLHPPSMLHRLSSASTAIYDIERKLKPLSTDYGVCILLVDGNDQCQMNHLKENLKDITSLIFMGEGLLMDEVSTAESAKQSSSPGTILLDLLMKLNPQFFIAFRYGANAFKADLEKQGFKNAEVWNLTNERSDVPIVDVWKDGNMFGRLKQHVSTIHKDKKKGYPSVEVLAWTPPTEDWRKKIRGNLSLKVGDVKEINKNKDTFIEAVKSERTKCFEIKPHAIDDDSYDHARAMTFYTCQESSRAIKDTCFYSTGWYYVSNNEHLMEVAKQMQDNEQSGCIVIWIDCIVDSSALKCFLEESITGDLKVIYIVTKNVETKDHDIVGQIKGINKLGTKDIQSIFIDRPKTDIELSQREVSVDITLLETTKVHGDTVLEELFDTKSTEGNSIEQHEATFHRGDDESIHMHVGIRNIKQLKQIFALMFFPDSREKLESKLKSIGLRTKLDFKMRNSLKVFKQCVLELETLTPYQKEVQRKADTQNRVVINGRAGSGKTFLLVHTMLKRLTSSGKINGKENDGLIFFCFDAESLGNEIVKWLCTRLGDSISIIDKNKILRRIHFFYISGERPGLLYHIQIDESDDEPKLVSDYDSLDDAMQYEYELILVDEGHHVLKKSGGGFLYRNTISRFLSKDKKRRKKIKRILKKNKDAQVMILCDSSQAPSTKLKWPKEFNDEGKHLTFTEVIRSLPVLTEASLVFQRFNQDETTNLNSKLKGHHGLRPGAIMFKSEGGEKDYQTYASKIVDELKKMMSFFPNENLHDSVAVIVSNDDSRETLLNAGLERKLLDEMEFRAVTAKEASERFSTDPPSDGKDYILVDTISNMNGLERLFVIVVDMDKPLDGQEGMRGTYDLEIEEKNFEEANQKNLSEIYCACTRGMLYVSFINKYIKDGWMSWFNFTEAIPRLSPTGIDDSSYFQNANIDDVSSYSFTTQAITRSDRNQDASGSSNVLLPSPSSLTLIEEEPSSVPISHDQIWENEDNPVGVADAVCQGQFDKTSSYMPFYVEVMARTKIFDISKPTLDSTEDIPTFHPLKLIEMNEDDAASEYEYEEGMDASSNVGFLSESIIKELDSPVIIEDIERDESVREPVGMRGDDPYIYINGRAPKVPFIVISPDVEEIQDFAFYENDVIEGLVIPKKVTHIGKRALDGCSNLKDVIFEEGSSLRHIRWSAFQWCPLIEEINLPASLETLGDSAFYQCEGLKKVTLSPKMTAIEEYTFNKCSSLTTVEGMNGIQSIGDAAFLHCSSLETIDVHQSADIHDRAFSCCNARINRIN